jgi:hypothetical protein
MGQKSIPTIMMVVVMSIVIATTTIATTIPTNASNATSDLKVFAIDVNNSIHELGLKATQMSNGQVIPANFEISPDNIIQIRQNENIVVFTSTDELQRIEKVKVTDANNIVTELVLSPTGYLIHGLGPGVYVLDVIVDSPTSSSKSAYETILVLLAPTQQPIQLTQSQITQIIQKTTVDVKVTFGDGKGNGKGCSNGLGSAGLSYPYQRKTECEHIEYQKCIRDGIFISDKCKDLRESFSETVMDLRIPRSATIIGII